MNLEGKVLLHLRLEHGRVAAASVESLRPLFASRVLEGRGGREALGSIGLLFSLCGRAQTVALATAMEAAGQRSVAPEVQCSRALHKLAEAAREHFWRLSIDLPRHLGETPTGTALAAIKRVFPSTLANDEQAWWEDALDPEAPRPWINFADALEAEIATALLGEPIPTWLARDNASAYAAWLATGTTPLAKSLALLQERNFATPSLPFLDPDHFAQVHAAVREDAAFARAPELALGPAETGPLASVSDAGLIRALIATEGCSMALRVIARVIALARLPSRLRLLARLEDPCVPILARTPAPGRGSSAVETARGWLLHDVEMDGDQLATLRIVAPTEWNFHPRGAFAQGMIGQPAASAEAAKARAALLAFALDPCVMWEIGVE